MTWRIGLSTGACIDRPLSDVLEAFHAIGVRGVELGSRPDHFDTGSPIRSRPWPRACVLWRSSPCRFTRHSVAQQICRRCSGTAARQPSMRSCRQPPP